MARQNRENCIVRRESALCAQLYEARNTRRFTLALEASQRRLDKHLVAQEQDSDHTAQLANEHHLRCDIDKLERLLAQARWRANQQGRLAGAWGRKAQAFLPASP